MQQTISIKNIWSYTRRLNRQTKMAIAVIFIIILISFIWQSWPSINQVFSAKPTKDLTQQNITVNEESPPNLQDKSTEITDNSDEDDGGITEYTVENGDTLAKILLDHGISNKEIFTLTNKYPQIAKDLRPDQTISWRINEDGALQSLTWVVNRKETRNYELTDKGFIENIDYTQGEWRELLIQGEIKMGDSFCGAARSYGISNAECQNANRYLKNLVNIKTLQPGDRFTFYIEREFVNEDITNSRLLAAHIHTRKRDRYIVYFDKNKSYYDEEGRTFAEGFLRIPVLNGKNFRISSHFNKKRINPVTKRISPHNGVDFAMPIGTAIVAAGDGEVTTAKFNAYAGNYIAIKHAKQYMTRYLHLSKISVRVGQIVKRGDIIGYSGNTGRSTGPHLHYEFWVDNKAVDPIKVILPSPKGLTSRDLVEFKKQVALVKSKMAMTKINTPEEQTNKVNTTESSLLPIPNEKEQTKPVISTGNEANANIAKLKASIAEAEIKTENLKASALKAERELIELKKSLSQMEKMATEQNDITPQQIETGQKVDLEPVPKSASEKQETNTASSHDLSRTITQRLAFDDASNKVTTARSEIDRAKKPIIINRRTLDYKDEATSEHTAATELLNHVAQAKVDALQRNVNQTKAKEKNPQSKD